MNRPLLGTFRATTRPAWLALGALIQFGHAMDPVAEKFQKVQQEMALGDSAPGAMAASSSTHPLWLSVEIAMVLLVVLVLAVLSIRLLKRVQSGMLRGPSGTGSDLFEMIETCHLTPNQKLIAVRMGDKIGIIGATKEAIHLIHILEKPAAEIMAERQTNPQAFADNLNRLLDRFKKPKKVSELLNEAQG
jgi:flagellar biogenesis protein FliO